MNATIRVLFAPTAAPVVRLTPFDFDMIARRSAAITIAGFSLMPHKAPRIDAKPFPLSAHSPHGKSHSSRGSSKSWPVGIRIEWSFK